MFMFLNQGKSYDCRIYFKVVPNPIQWSIAYGCLIVPYF